MCKHQQLSRKSSIKTRNKWHRIWIEIGQRSRWANVGSNADMCWRNCGVNKWRKGWRRQSRVYCGLKKRKWLQFARPKLFRFTFQQKNWFHVVTLKQKLSHAFCIQSVQKEIRRTRSATHKFDFSAHTSVKVAYLKLILARNFICFTFFRLTITSAVYGHRKIVINMSIHSGDNCRWWN